MLAILAGTALMTADPRDPSFNTAVDGPVTNALGPLGATLADLLDQVFGLGGWLVVLIPAAWGMRVLVRAQAPRLWGLRIALLPLVVVVWAVALAALPLPHLSGVAVGPGGALGKVIVAAFVAPMFRRICCGRWVVPVWAWLFRQHFRFGSVACRLGRAGFGRQEVVAGGGFVAPQSGFGPARTGGDGDQPLTLGPADNGRGR